MSRSDYKPSYILEQEWEAKQKAGGLFWDVLKVCMWLCSGSLYIFYWHVAVGSLSSLLDFWEAIEAKRRKRWERKMERLGILIILIRVWFHAWWPLHQKVLAFQIFPRSGFFWKSVQKVLGPDLLEKSLLPWQAKKSWRRGATTWWRRRFHGMDPYIQCSSCFLTLNQALCMSRPRRPDQCVDSWAALTSK